MKEIWSKNDGGIALKVFDAGWNDRTLNVSMVEVRPNAQGGTDQITTTVVLKEEDVESLKVTLMSWPPYRLC